MHEETSEKEWSPEAKRLAVRRVLLGLIFVLGTLLAFAGWFIEWKGLDQVSVKLQHWTLLALVGHAIQVAASFALLVTPGPESVDETIESKVSIEKPAVFKDYSQD